MRLRQMLASNAARARRPDELEKKNDTRFQVVFDAIRELTASLWPRGGPSASSRAQPSGFRVEEARPARGSAAGLKRELNY